MAIQKDLKPLSYYRWFWQDFRANRKVQRMNYIERGLYRELLDECWAEGGFHDDVSEMAEICGCPVDVMASAWQVLASCFVLVDGIWHNEKMDSVRTEKDRERVNKQNAGRKGGICKAMNQKDSVALASTSQAVASVCHIEEKRREEKNTPLTPQGGNPVGQPATPPDADQSPGKVRKPREQKPAMTLTDWLTALDGKQAIRDDDPILAELEDAGVSRQYALIAWHMFKAQFANKRQKDWPAHFRNAIRGNWLKAWWFDGNGDCKLTTAGELARRAMEAGQ